MSEKSQEFIPLVFLNEFPEQNLFLINELSSHVKVGNESLSDASN